MKRILLILSLPLLTFLVQCQTTGIAPGLTGGDPYWPEEVPEGPIVFEQHVKPLLEMNCMECHNDETAPLNGGLNLTTRELAMTTGRTPPVIRPGDPENSLLIQVLSLNVAHTLAMPPTPEKVFGVREAILRQWIEEGADWPGNVRLSRPQDWKRKGPDGQYRG